jgi:hypothetical protein
MGWISRFSVLAASSCVTAWACGGQVTSDSADAGTPFDAGPPDEAGYTQCTTPEGWGICGPATGCPSGSSRPGCFNCLCPAHDGLSSQCVAGVPRESVGICGDLEGVLADSFDSMASCQDGLVRYDWAGAGFLGCAPYSVGLLISRYVNDHDRLRYADFGLFTGAALPTPTKCEAFAGFQICGGPCGPCGAGQTCTGRSALHPYSFCVTDSSAYACRIPAQATGPEARQPCPAAEGCFTFTVEPDAQALSDKNGMCLPLAQCRALAAGLPGGGTCTQQ